MIPDPVVALVTGGYGAVGSAVAERLTKDGFVVVRHSRSKGPYTADLRRKHEAEALVRRVERAFGNVGVLVHAAADKIDNLVRDVDADTFDLNLKGTVHIVSSLLPGMVNLQFGRIVLLSSVASARAYRGTAAYTAAKAGVEAFSRVVAVEHAKDGITCNVVAPGFLNAGLGAALPERVRRSLIDAVPMGRPGTVEEAADACAFLCAPRTGYVTGQVLRVDGGLSL